MRSPVSHRVEIFRSQRLCMRISHVNPLDQFILFSRTRHGQSDTKIVDRPESCEFSVVTKRTVGCPLLLKILTDSYYITFLHGDHEGIRMEL